MQRLSNLLFLLLLLGFTACDSNNDEDDRPGALGSATVKVEGAASAETEFSGFSVFSIVTEDEESYFNLVITDATITGPNVSRIVTFQMPGERPDVDEYAIGMEGVFTLYMAETGTEDDVIVGGDEGTLTITRSTDSRLEGTFTFTGVELASEEEVTVTGSFKAIYVDEDFGGSF